MIKKGTPEAFAHAHEQLDTREKRVRTKEIEVAIKHRRLNQILSRRASDPALLTEMMFETVNSLWGGK